MKPSATARLLSLAAGSVALVACAIAGGSAGAIRAHAASAPPTPKRGGTLTVACGQAEIGTLDAAQNSACQVDTYNQIYDTLVHGDQRGNVTPEAAKSWTITDHGLIYTFHLQPGMTFHDGAPVNAAAVKFSILRMLNPTALGSGSVIRTVVRRISTPNSMTVRLLLYHDDSFLLFNLSRHEVAPIVDPALVQANGNNIANVDAGSGPFEVVPGSFNAGVNGGVTLQAFPKYWKLGVDGKPLPYLDQVKIVCIADTTTRVLNLQSHTIDVADAISTTFLGSLADGGYRIFGNFFGTQPTLFLNEGVAPFNNPEVRQAVVEAIDLSTIAKTWSLNKAALYPMWFAGNFAFKTPAFKYDPTDAKAKLTAAGFPNGFTTSIDVISGQLPDINIAPILQQELKQNLNITLNINTLDRATWISTTNQGQVPMAIQQGGQDPIPDIFLDRFNPNLTGPNAGVSVTRDNWTDADAQAAYAEMIAAEKTTDLAQQKMDYQDVVNHVVHANIWVCMGVVPSPAVAAPYVRGFQPNAGNAEYYWEMWDANG